MTMLTHRAEIGCLVTCNSYRNLRLTAQYADLWNSGAEPSEYKRKNAVLDAWCGKVGRPPTAIERTVNIYGRPTLSTCDDYVAAGAQHIILNVGAPWDLSPVEQLIQWRDTRGGRTC